MNGGGIEEVRMPDFDAKLQAPGQFMPHVSITQHTTYKIPPMGDPRPPLLPNQDRL
jgi:hypothetical protein